MPVNVNELIRKLSPAERRKVEDRAREIVAEEMSLRQLRKARKLTQVRVAKVLGVTQDSISRLEKRSGSVALDARKNEARHACVVASLQTGSPDEFPDRRPVSLFVGSSSGRMKPSIRSRRGAEE
jgi:DNA-binding XRE family transcriptional regulator